MASKAEALIGLEKIFQHYEQEIVIELGADRVLYLIGVYITILLAIAAKFSEITKKDISCHPASNETGFDSSFITFANTHCWESGQSGIAPENHPFPVCNITRTEERKLISDPDFIKEFIIWMPYGMLFQAFFFSLPSAWWHFRVGGRLMGHLKFMKLFIGEIYEQLKDVPAGIHSEEPYDKDSIYFDGWCDKDLTEENNRSLYRKGNSESEPDSDESGQKTIEQMEEEKEARYYAVRGKTISYKNKDHEKAKKCKETAERIRRRLEYRRHKKNMKKKKLENENKKDEQKDDEQGKKKNFWTEFFLGTMLDRQLFSMLCYENFSSMQQHPYLISLFKLTRNDHYELSTGIMPLNEGILHQWCHKRNFSGKFLMWSYVMKHVISIIISCALICVLGWFVNVLSKNLNSESYLCYVMFHEDVCMICTLHRKKLIFALTILDLIIVVIHLLLSAGQWIFILRSPTRSTAFFFEDLRCLQSVAMWAVLKNKQEEKKKEK